MTNLLLVPIHTDALYLEEDTLMTEPTVDFARLPFFNGTRDVNADVAHISENFAAPPLQNQNQRYRKGLHLHWSLPDALTRGKHITPEGEAERSTLDFPTVPNRWLIIRTGSGLEDRQWIIESDYFWPEERAYEEIAFPKELIERAIRQMRSVLRLLNQRKLDNGLINSRVEEAKNSLDAVEINNDISLFQRLSTDSTAVFDLLFDWQADYPNGLTGDDQSKTDLELTLNEGIAQLELTLDEVIEKRKRSITYPIPLDSNAEGSQTFRYMGRAVPLEHYSNTPENDASYLDKLTAIGYGEPTFSAFYPNCKSIFGFHDPEGLPNDPGTTYYIIGWYNDENEDFLKQIKDLGPAEILANLGEFPQWMINTKINKAEFQALFNDPSETDDIWKQLVAKNWLKYSSGANQEDPDEAIILFQKNLPDLDSSIHTPKRDIKQILKDFLADNTPDPFPDQMICFSKLIFQRNEVLVHQSDFNARLRTMLENKGVIISDSDSNADLNEDEFESYTSAIWNELVELSWIELDPNSSTKAFLLSKNRRTGKPEERTVKISYGNGDCSGYETKIISTMLEAAFVAAPPAVTIANTGREALAARLAHALVPPDPSFLKIRSLEEDILMLSNEIEQLERKAEKVALTDTEEKEKACLEGYKSEMEIELTALKNTAETAINTNRKQRLRIEDQLEALFFSNRLDHRQLDIGAKFRERRHEQGFNAVSTDGLWTVRPERDADQNAQEMAEAGRYAPNLGNDLAETLEKLNQFQQQYDKERFRIDHMREQLYADWYKYMLSTYPPQDSLTDYPDIDEVRYFIQEKDLKPLWEKMQRTGQLLLDHPSSPTNAGAEIELKNDSEFSEILERELEMEYVIPEEALRDVLSIYIDTDTRISQLEISEINDWLGLAHTLQDTMNTNSTTVWSLLPADVQQLVVALSENDSATDEDKKTILEALQDLLMLATSTAETIASLLEDLIAYNTNLSLLNKEDILNWSRFFEQLSHSNDVDLIEHIKNNLPTNIGNQINAQSALRSDVLSSLNAILTTDDSQPVLAVALDILRDHGHGKLEILQLKEGHVSDWEGMITALQNRATDSPEEALYEALDVELQERIDIELADDLAVERSVRVKIIQAIKGMLWNSIGDIPFNSLSLLRVYGVPELRLGQVQVDDIKDWAALLAELKGPRNADLELFWQVLPDSVQDQLTNNEIKDILIDEEEKDEIILSLNDILSNQDFRPLKSTIVDLLDDFGYSISDGTEIILVEDITDWPGLVSELQSPGTGREKLVSELLDLFPAHLIQLVENSIPESDWTASDKLDIAKLFTAIINPREEVIVRFNRTYLETWLVGTIRPSLKGTYRLQRITGPRYWRPKEPHVLISGDIAQHSDRFARDGRLYQGLLECKIEDQLTIDIDTLLADPNQIQELQQAIDNNTDLEIGFKTVNGPTWNPFLLEWEASVCPLESGSNVSDGAYAEDYIERNLHLPVNAVDMAVDNSQVYVGTNQNIYNGRSLLTSHAQKSLGLRLTEYVNQNPSGTNDLDDPTYTAAEAKAALEGMEDKLLSQCLSGFNEAMMMLRQSYQLPIKEPIGFSDYQDFTALVEKLVGRCTKLAPQPLTDFTPIRTGKLQLNQLRLVDTFGQYQQLDFLDPHSGPEFYGSSFGHTELDTVENRIQIELSPRLAQAARLHFRWLAAESLLAGETEMNSFSASTPICGWLLSNHLDGSLMVFDKAGKSLGAIENEWEGTLAKWTPAPGLESLNDPNAIDNQHLGKIVKYLREQGPDYVIDFIKATDNVIQTIEPETYEHQQALSLLMGRPLALVRASIDLELKGVPAVHHSWEAFYRDRQDGDEERETDNYTNVRFPIRLGAVSQSNDGLVGYWLEDENGNLINSNAPSNSPIFYLNQLEEEKVILGTTTDLIVYLNDDQVPISQSLDVEDIPQVVSMLIDPRAKVHAFSGILPVKEIDIPADQYLPSMQAIDITFLTSPILTPAENIYIHQPKENGYVWQWIEKENGSWKETGLRQPFTDADFFSEHLWVREGWMKLKDESVV